MDDRTYWCLNHGFESFFSIVYFFNLAWLKCIEMCGLCHVEDRKQKLLSLHSLRNIKQLNKNNRFLHISFTAFFLKECFISTSLPLLWLTHRKYATLRFLPFQRNRNYFHRVYTTRGTMERNPTNHRCCVFFPHAKTQQEPTPLLTINDMWRTNAITENVMDQGFLSINSLLKPQWKLQKSSHCYLATDIRHERRESSKSSQSIESEYGVSNALVSLNQAVAR